MLKIRRSRDRFIFNMGIPILVKRHVYIETAPRSLICSNLSSKPGPRACRTAIQPWVPAGSLVVGSFVEYQGMVRDDFERNRYFHELNGSYMDLNVFFTLHKMTTNTPWHGACIRFCWKPQYSELQIDVSKIVSQWKILQVYGKCGLNIEHDFIIYCTVIFGTFRVTHIQAPVGTGWIRITQCEISVWIRITQW